MVEWLDVLPLGTVAETSKTFAEADAYLYAGIVGDFNSLYVNEPRAREAGLPGRVAPWAMLGGCLGVVAMEITRPITPPGTVSVGYDLSFELPIAHGDTITTSFTLAEKNEERQLLIFQVRFTNQRGEKVGEGKAYSKVTKPA